LIQERSVDFRLDGPQKLRILMREEEDTKRFVEARLLLERLDIND